jgi:membrane fusion protein, multidrug efflux system
MIGLPSMSRSATTYQGDVLDRPTTRTRRIILRWSLMAGGVLAVIIGGGAYWLSGGRWVETDDAYVQADSMVLSTDVFGIVASIPVHEGETVTEGQVLFRLDPQKFQIELDNARASLRRFA